jgi:predicted lipoprotein with Yx(FWY)xxD motif
MRRYTAKRVVAIVAAILILALLGAATAIATSGHGSNATSTGTNRLVVKTMKNATLGKTILTTRRGMTLYHLTAEKRGRFICTKADCLSDWHPLVVPAGVTPTGARFLATIKRPDGRRQVTYRGAPLYTFADDRKAGDVKGNGFKDVGTWLAMVVASTSTPPPTTTTAPTTTYSAY